MFGRYKTYALNTLRKAWGAGFGMGKEQALNEMRTMSKEDIDKKYWNFECQNSLPICLLCLNFQEKEMIHNSKRDYLKYSKTRYTLIGTCFNHGWEVSAFDRCDCWQDDA